MSLVPRGLIGVIIALWRALRNNAQVLMKLLIYCYVNQRHRAMIVAARMKVNGNFSDISLERLYSVPKNAWWARVTVLTWSRPWLAPPRISTCGYSKQTLTFLFIYLRQKIPITCYGYLSFTLIHDAWIISFTKKLLLKNVEKDLFFYDALLWC